MKTLIKPKRLAKGDTIATVSPCNGWAGDMETRWVYDLGISRLREIGLQVVAAPNSMRGSDYLSKNPKTWHLFSINSENRSFKCCDSRELLHKS